MLINSISVSNPVGAISKIREYRQHIRFPIKWKLINVNDQHTLREMFGVGDGQPHLSLIVPIVNESIMLSECRLHNSPCGINPSFNAIRRVDEYVLFHEKLPDYCGFKVVLTGEEKVNLMNLLY